MSANCARCWFASGGDADHCGKCTCCPTRLDKLTDHLASRYENHEWTGNDPDYCACCGVDWDDADITCEEIR